MIPWGSDLPEVYAAQVIFCILLPIVFFAPLRWSILAWLVMGNLDASAGPQATDTAIGWINTVKAIGLPLYLFLRLRRTPSQSWNSWPARIWIALTAYAALAALWSAFPLPAIKLVGNMIGILLAILVLEKAVKLKVLNSELLAILMLTSLLLGVIQTYFIQGVSYGFDGPDQPLRFTSFIAAQQYAAFLVGFLAIALWREDFTPTMKSILAASLCVAIAFNGSRTWCFGAAIVLIAYAWKASRRITAVFALGTSTAILAVLLAQNVTQRDSAFFQETSNRVLSTLTAVFVGQDTSNNSGLQNLNFRLAIYQGVLDSLRSSDTSELLFGHGTSSGANIGLRVFPTRYNIEKIDANRIIHNEWLRALYEWGILGFMIWISVFVSVVIGVLRRYMRNENRPQVSAVLSFLPAVLAALATENIVAGAGNAVTLSLAILVGLLWESPQCRSRPYPIVQRRIAA
jgi:O-antigen ligase